MLLLLLLGGGAGAADCVLLILCRPSVLLLLLAARLRSALLPLLVCLASLPLGGVSRWTLVLLTLFGAAALLPAAADTLHDTLDVFKGNIVQSSDRGLP